MLEKLFWLNLQRKLLFHEIMETDVVTVSPSDNLEYCMELMSTKVRHLPVLENEIVIGIISISDVVKAIIEMQKIRSNINSYITQ
jgi:predicted transcriptional regulator